MEDWGVGFPEGFADGADGGFDVGAGLLEAGKVMRPEQILTGFVHGVEIQVGIPALPGIGTHEGVFYPVYEVGIFTPAGAEAGMKIIRHRSDRMDSHAAG